MPKSLKKLTILILGGAGFYNSGDEALLRACVQVCRDYAPTARLILAANNIEIARETLAGYELSFVPSPRLAFFRSDEHYGKGDDVFKSRWSILRDELVIPPAEEARQALVESPHLDFIDRTQALDFWDALLLADVVVLHGGGVLTSATRSRLWEHALTVELARRLGKRVLLRSHQLGPFTDENDRARIRTILQYACYVSTRDYLQSSQEVKLYGNQSKIIDQVDDAVILRMDQAPGPVLARYNLTPGAFICVGYRDNPSVGVGQNMMKRTAKIVHRAHEIFGLPIALLPQVPFDIEALNCLASNLKVPCQVVIPEDPFRDPILIASQARLMIACPHHSLIFALRGGVPILSPVSGEYYYFKNKGSMRFFGLEEFVFDVEDADYLETSNEKLVSILVEGDHLRHRIAFRLNELRAQASINDLTFARRLLGEDAVSVFPALL